MCVSAPDMEVATVLVWGNKGLAVVRTHVDRDQERVKDAEYRRLRRRRCGGGGIERAGSGAVSLAPHRGVT
jgi:hypothetical protein